MDLEEELSQLEGELSPHIPTHMLGEFRELIRAGEYGIGLETLCDRLSDAEVPLTYGEVTTIKHLANKMSLDYPGIDEVAQLATLPSRQDH
ncbi:hypothetical protein GCM10023221_21160 [Luteimicrobium xylanilyticum]|uniref:MafI family immunity protein n=1 Tax=Luteimicrobium xylanilyticum TaxID=1133546 RepID=UPI001883E988|nr:MafI family immunity protein [Luteimicrobium xylanilyticum]